jgi:hypothetical protein
MYEFHNLPPLELSADALVEALSSDAERRRLTALWYVIDHPRGAVQRVAALRGAILDHVCLPCDGSSNEALRHAAVQAAVAIGAPIVSEALARLCSESGWRTAGALGEVIASSAPAPYETRVHDALAGAAEHDDVRTRKQLALAIRKHDRDGSSGLLSALQRDDDVREFLERVDAGVAAARELTGDLIPAAAQATSRLSPAARKQIDDYQTTLGGIADLGRRGIPTRPGSTHPYLERLRHAAYLELAVQTGDQAAMELCRDHLRFLDAAHDFGEESDDALRLLEEIHALDSLSLPTKRLLAARIGRAKPDEKEAEVRDIRIRIEIIKTGWESVTDDDMRMEWVSLAGIENVEELIGWLGARAALAETDGGIGAREWLVYFDHARSRKAEALYCLANAVAQKLPAPEHYEAIVQCFEDYGLRPQAKALRARFRFLGNW